MSKKKQTFSLWRIIKTTVLFFVVGMLVILFIMGIEDKNNFPAQHEKEIKEWEEIVERSCTISSDIKEEYLPRNSSQAMLLKSRIDSMKKNPKYYSEEEIKEKEEELKKANEKIKYYCWGDNICSSVYPVNQSECSINKSNLSSIKDKNPPSIFYYYGKTIEYIIGSITSMFFILLVLILTTLFEVHKIKNKNNTY